jgi:hypothetical protein
MVRGVKKLRLVKETYQYIPLLKTLKALLNQPDVLTEVSCCENNIKKNKALFEKVLTLFCI